VHTVAPSSISPWLSAPGSSPRASSSASLQSRFCAAGLRKSPSIASRRASTRATLPSTIGAGLSNAIEASAPAV
jgi:hypothetical protein